MENPYFTRDSLSDQEKDLIKGVQKLAKAIAGLEPNIEYTGTAPQAVIVGGFVRDVFMGLKPKDADIEVRGVAPEKLKEILKELFGEISLAGESFEVLKVNLGNGLDLDVSVPRHESKKSPGHKGFEIQGDPSMDIIEAARRRDFTINAMSMDPLTGVVFDPFGGLEDIKSRKLRVTDSAHFGEDALRVLRAAQFVSRFNLTVEPESFRLMRGVVAGPEFYIVPAGKKSSEEIGLAAGRFAEEWSKLLLKGQKPSCGLELMRQLGIFEKIYPEIASQISADGGEEKWQQLIKRVDAVRQGLEVKGKDFSKNTKEMILLSVFCQDWDKAVAREFLNEKKLTLDKKEVLLPAIALSREFCSLDHSGELNDREFSGHLVSIFERLGGISSEIYLTVYETNALESEQEEKTKIVSRARELVKKYVLSATPLVGGKDILEIKPGFKPGKEMGQIIEQIKQKRRTGEIVDVDEARVELRKLLKLED